MISEEATLAVAVAEALETLEIPYSTGTM